MILLGIYDHTLHAASTMHALQTSPHSMTVTYLTVMIRIMAQCTDEKRYFTA